MNPTELKRVKAVFAEAVEKAGADRLAFLDQSCGDDQGLRAEVQAFLSASDRAGDALGSPTIASPGADAVTVDAADTRRDGPGSTIGPYKLLQLIGEGGFGSVFMAEQERPVRRRVALKIIKLGMDTKQVIARFEAERQALAMMDHLNIARVFEAGATDAGRPYFVMELVRGVPITEYCDTNRLDTNQRLELFVTVCHAIQHAHQKGIIHRDIKPSNVLVTLHDGVPVPKVIDFGIAKATNSRLTEKTLFTEFRQFIGTPAYVSPEQAEMSGLDIDTRSDIYSLGVLLYELLTGTTPFDPKELYSVAYNEIQRIIREVDPPKPSTRLSTLGEPISKLAANRSVDPKKFPQVLRGDLDWIVMKALEKDRTRRYDTPNELARDISRHLKDETIEACPPSVVYRVRRFVRRNRIAVYSATALVVTAALAIAIYIHGIRTEQHKTFVALVEATTARTDADRQRNEAVQATTRATDAEAQANENFVRAAILQARAALESIQSGRRFDSLALLVAAAKISPTAAVRSQAIACMGLVDARITRVWGGTIAKAGANQASDTAADFNFDCTAYADRSPAGEVLIRRIPNAGEEVGSLIVKLPCHVSQWLDVEFSPYDQLVSAGCTDNHLRVFKLDGELVLDIPGGSAGAFTPDGKGFAARKQNGPVVIYDLKSGQGGQPLWPGEKSPWLGSNAIAFSPDGSKLAMWNVYRSRDVVVGELATGKTVRLPHPKLVTRVDWSPDGTVLATAMPSGERKGVYLWDLNARPDPVPRIIAGPQSAFSVKFSHGGDLVASSGWDGTTCLMDAVSGEELVQLFFSGLLRFSPDDRTLTSRNGASVHVQVEVATARERRVLAAPHGHRDRQVAFSPDGILLACGGDDRVRFWNLGSGVISEPPVDLMMGTQTRFVVFHPDGASAMVSADNGIWRVPVVRPAPAGQMGAAPPRQMVQIGPKEPFNTQFRGGDGAMQFTGDGAAMALAAEGHDTLVFDPQGPAHPVRLPMTRDVMFASISNDGKWVATGTWNGHGDQRVGVWDAHSGALKCRLPVPMDANVAFSPDNQWLVTGSSAEFRFWEVGSWQLKHDTPMNSERVGLIAFSGDSRTAALSTERYGVRLLDMATMTELATLESDGDQRPLGFSRDGSLLVTFGPSNTFRLWDLRRIREQLNEMGLDWAQPALPPPPVTALIDITLAEPKLAPPTTLP